MVLYTQEDLNHSSHGCSFCFVCYIHVVALGWFFSRLNGLVTGVSGVVKGCLLRPLQERLAPSPLQSNVPADANANPLDLANFEPRYLKCAVYVCVYAHVFYVIN